MVAPAVSLSKLERQVALWRANESLHRQRGLVLTRHDGLEVDLLVLAPCAPVPLAVAAVRLVFDNYDLWPPSLAFADPLTGEPLALGAFPATPAWDVREQPPRSLVPGPHPETGRTFLCVPGIREYHVMPEHSGDHWLRYRGAGMSAPGTLQGIVTTLHKTTAATVRGIAVQTEVLIGPTGLEVQLQFALARGPALLATAAAPAEPAVVDLTGPGVGVRPAEAGANA